MQALSDDELGHDRRVQAGAGERRHARRYLPDAFAVGARGQPPRHRHAPLRRAAHRRHGAARAARSPRCAPARARRWSPRCPVYLNALDGKGVHVVTVNDYLAKRDREWMGQIYRFLRPLRRRDPDDASTPTRARSARDSYASDITYGTNNEFGFDYLRDNMVPRPDVRRAAPASLRHRGRGRQHPDRRGAHAAHHLRPGRGVGGPLRQVRPLMPQPRAKTTTTRSTRMRTRRPHRRGHRKVERLLGIDEPL